MVDPPYSQHRVKIRSRVVAFVLVDDICSLAGYDRGRSPKTIGSYWIYGRGCQRRPECSQHVQSRYSINTPLSVLYKIRGVVPSIKLLFYKESSYSLHDWTQELNVSFYRRELFYTCSDCSFSTRFA